MFCFVRCHLEIVFASDFCSHSLAYVCLLQCAVGGQDGKGLTAAVARAEVAALVGAGTRHLSAPRLQAGQLRARGKVQERLLAGAVALAADIQASGGDRDGGQQGGSPHPTIPWTGRFLIDKSLVAMEVMMHAERWEAERGGGD